MHRLCLQVAVILGPPTHTHTHTTHSMTTVLRHPIAMPTASLHLRCQSVSDTAEVGNITSFVHIVHEMVSDRLAHTHPSFTHTRTPLLHTHISLIKGDEPSAFPAHQPVLDPPGLKDNSFLTSSMEAYGIPEDRRRRGEEKRGEEKMGGGGGCKD